MRLVVFDMDGTLLDSAGTIVSRVTRAFESMRLPVPPVEAMRANVGLSLPIYMGRLAGTGDEGVVNGLMTAYRNIAQTDPVGMMPLFAGAREALDRLRAVPDVLLGIATGKGRLGVERALSQNGLDGYFDTIQTPDTNPSKPDPAMLYAAMAATGTARDNAVMIGDAAFDAEMAVAARVACIGVSWGLQAPAEILDAGASLIIDRFDQLDGAIDQLLGARHA